MLKIIHLASSSHIWSLFAANHMLTKVKVGQLQVKSQSAHYFTQFISKVHQ